MLITKNLSKNTNTYILINTFPQKNPSWLLGFNFYLIKVNVSEFAE